VAHELRGGEVGRALRSLPIEHTEHRELPERHAAVGPQPPNELAEHQAEIGRRLHHRIVRHVRTIPTRMSTALLYVYRMPIEFLPRETALVLVDLQQGITSMPTIHPADAIVERAAALAVAFRERALPVALVRVSFAADGADSVRVAVDQQSPPLKLGPDFATYRAEIGSAPDDIQITKRGWDGFFGTELDLQLRRRGIRGIVLGGIRTCIGVESTARTGFALNYAQVLATDATTDVSLEAHENSLRHIFPRISRLAETDAIIAALPS
jgi:nicotinamidase-related amidase